MRAAGGFSLIELLVALAITMVLVAAVAGLASPARQVVDAGAESVDVEQSARLGLDALYRDISAAGAGMDSGPAAGPLVERLAPVLPRRIGAESPDPATSAHPDAITLLRLPAMRPQAVLSGQLAAGAAPVAVPSGCLALADCGFRSETDAMIFDETGRFALFTIERVDPSALTLRPHGSGIPFPFGSGAAVSAVEARTYYFDSAAHQIRVYDTDTTDVPLLDEVTSLRIEYFGRREPPLRPKPPAGDANCLYDAAGAALPAAALAADANGEAALPLSLFTDGPWCGVPGFEFDADLLRVRRVRLTLGIQSSSSSLRGTGARFAEPGSSTSVWRRVEDVVVAIDVAPRNLAIAETGAP